MLLGGLALSFLCPPWDFVGIWHLLAGLTYAYIIIFGTVVAFGRISLVMDEGKAREIGTALVKKFTDDEAYLEKELKHALPRVQCLALVPEHMTGKLVNES